MPWGLVIIGALSLVVYRRAEYSGRSSIGMVLLLWVAMFGGFMLGSLPGYVAVEAGAPFEVLPLMAIAGGIMGARYAIREAGRRISTPAATPADDPTDSGASSSHK